MISMSNPNPNPSPKDDNKHCTNTCTYILDMQLYSVHVRIVID